MSVDLPNLSAPYPAGDSGNAPPLLTDSRFEAPAPRKSVLTLLLAVVMLLAISLAMASYIAFDQDDAGRGYFSTNLPPPASTLAPLPPPPPVEPVTYLDLTRTAAQAINAAVPFTKDRVPAARPLLLQLSALDEQRAVDCLAAAGWYEAGDSLSDQQPVMQVVLNRMRHAAFPKTVCGVVFQGSERQTGCQFSFTCDGSMQRRTPSPAAWTRAQGLARAAIGGMVYAPVGWATHYHTDWVVPNWSATVDKVAAVRTHLFFRWRGANGQPNAFRGVHSGPEPAIAMLARLSPAHGNAPPAEVIGDTTALPVPRATSAPAIQVDVPQAILRGNQLHVADATDNLFVLQIKPGEFGGTLALIALDMCKQAQKACTVVGFTGTPGRVTSNGMGRTNWPDRQPDFYYFVDRSRGRENVLWNCDALPRPDQRQCMPGNFRAEG